MLNFYSLLTILPIFSTKNQSITNTRPYKTIEHNTIPVTFITGNINLYRMGRSATRMTKFCNKTCHTSIIHMVGIEWAHTGGGRGGSYQLASALTHQIWLRSNLFLLSLLLIFTLNAACSVTLDRIQAVKIF